MATKEVGIIGLGLLGSALAERLLADGYLLLCYDIDPAGCRKAEALGSAIAPDPLAPARNCSRLLLSLPDSGVVRRVVEQIDAVLRPGMRWPCLRNVDMRPPQSGSLPP